MIYAFLNQKGGVGKTTLSVHVADVLARRGSRVLLIDADPQQSSINWSRERAQHERPETFSVVAKAVDTLHKEIRRLSANYDHVVIDGPPRVHEVAKSIILAADIIVSLAGYPRPMAEQIFGGPARKDSAPDLDARAGNVFDAVRQHLRSRYGFDLTAVLAPARRLNYLTGMIHYARLREALLAEYNV